MRVMVTIHLRIDDLDDHFLVFVIHDYDRTTYNGIELFASKRSLSQRSNFPL